MALTKDARDLLPESSFAVPSKRALPIHDATHVKMAWRMVDRTHGLSETERKTARERILHKAKELGIDTDDWHTIAAMAIDAMAIIMPEVKDHPNKMPFSGVLTRLDQPSDQAPHGSAGKLVYLPKDVAERALPSLLGMAVDFEAGFEGHDPQAKIGVITAATINGDAIHVEGFIYASDFPEEAVAIQRDKDKLGFSFEMKRVQVETMDANPLVITDCVFTGAAILKKDRAAYTTTSLAASADQMEEDISMSPEDLKKILSEAINPLAETQKSITDRLEKIEAAGKTINAGAEHTRAAIEPHASALESCAASMEAAGIGNHPTAGHAVVLRRMAGSMRAAAALGQMPHIYRDHDYGYNAAADKSGDTAKAVEDATKPLLDKIASLGTQFEDLKAAAFKKADEPQRKTVDPKITALLAKAGIGEPEGDAKVNPHDLSKALTAAGMNNRDILAAKAALAHAGLMD